MREFIIVHLCYPREEIHRPSKTGRSHLNATLLWPGVNQSLQLFFSIFIVHLENHPQFYGTAAKSR